MNMSLPFAFWLPPGEAVTHRCQIRTDAFSARDPKTVEDKPWRDCWLWPWVCKQVET